MHTSQQRPDPGQLGDRAAPDGEGTRVHLRLRLGPVRRKRLAEYVGGALDWATIVGLAAGLRERLAALEQRQLTGARGAAASGGR